MFFVGHTHNCGNRNGAGSTGATSKLDSAACARMRASVCVCVCVENFCYDLFTLELSDEQTYNCHTSHTALNKVGNVCASTHIPYIRWRVC